MQSFFHTVVIAFVVVVVFENSICPVLRSIRLTFLRHFSFLFFSSLALNKKGQREGRRDVANPTPPGVLQRATEQQRSYHQRRRRSYPLARECLALLFLASATDNMTFFCVYFSGQATKECEWEVYRQVTVADDEKS